MRIFGGVLPWIGFRETTMPLDVAGEYWPPGVYKLAPGSMNDVMVNALEVEWFGVGIMLSVRPIQ